MLAHHTCQISFNLYCIISFFSEFELYMCMNNGSHKSLLGYNHALSYLLLDSPPKFLLKTKYILHYHCITNHHCWQLKLLYYSLYVLCMSVSSVWAEFISARRDAKWLEASEGVGCPTLNPLFLVCMVLPELHKAPNKFLEFKCDNKYSLLRWF